VKNIQAAPQAAEALRPLAGKGAYWLFTRGLVGTGMLGVPVLAGSCVYTIAEAARWRGASLNKKFHLARRFYSVIAVSVLISTMDFTFS
jgi:Mn2+/Fe2+ NRAMP family transporter